MGIPRFGFVIVLLLAGSARADSWRPPQIMVAASPDGSALVRIAPGNGGEDGRGAVATVLKYDAATGGYQKTIEFSLRNPVSPHDAVISNDARFIVAFDDWFKLGRTDNAVVVYRGTGELVRAWKLADIFSAEERKNFPESTTSTWWRGEVAVLEKANGDPVVVIKSSTEQARPGVRNPGWQAIAFDVVKQSFEKM